MPELPDIENARICLQRSVTGASITDLIVGNMRRLFPDPHTVRAAAIGETVVSLGRRGKVLRLGLSNNKFLAIHLMLTGSLRLDLKSQDAPDARISLELSNGTLLRVFDPRNLAKLTLEMEILDDKQAGPPDALDVDREALADILDNAGRKSVKLTLIDQATILGIGNAYADEILWVARVSPLSSSMSIPPRQVAALHEAMRTVLHDAIAYVNKVDPTGSAVEIRSHLRIHSAQLHQSPTGYPIKSAKLGGRRSYYTDEQVRYG